MHHLQVKPGVVMSSSRSMESRTGRSKQRKSAPSISLSMGGPIPLSALVATPCTPSEAQRALVLTLFFSF